MKFDEDFLHLLIYGNFIVTNDQFTYFRVNLQRNKSFNLIMNEILKQTNLKIQSDFEVMWDDSDYLDIYCNVEKNGRVYQAMLPINVNEFENPLEFFLVFDKGSGPSEYDVSNIYV